MRQDNGWTISYFKIINPDNYYVVIPLMSLCSSHHFSSIQFWKLISQTVPPIIVSAHVLLLVE